MIYYSTMPRPHRYRSLPDDPLHATKPIPGVPLDVQSGHMLELRQLQNSIAAGYDARDDRMLALALSDTLSRADMAVATGLAKSRVDQLIRGRSAWYDEQRRLAAAERVVRHLPS